jgi:hypothetical protein
MGPSATGVCGLKLAVHGLLGDEDGGYGDVVELVRSARHIRAAVPAYVSIRQQTSAYVSIRQRTSAYVGSARHVRAAVPVVVVDYRRARPRQLRVMQLERKGAGPYSRLPHAAAALYER